MMLTQYLLEFFINSTRVSIRFETHVNIYAPGYMRELQ